MKKKLIAWLPFAGCALLSIWLLRDSTQPMIAKYRVAQQQCDKSQEVINKWGWVRVYKIGRQAPSGTAGTVEPISIAENVDLLTGMINSSRVRLLRMESSAPPDEVISFQVAGDYQDVLQFLRMLTVVNSCEVSSITMDKGGMGLVATITYRAG